MIYVGLCSTNRHERIRTRQVKLAASWMTLRDPRASLHKGSQLKAGLRWAFGLRADYRPHWVAEHWRGISRSEAAGRTGGLLPGPINSRYNWKSRHEGDQRLPN